MTITTTAAANTTTNATLAACQDTVRRVLGTTPVADAAPHQLYTAFDALWATRPTGMTPSAARRILTAVLQGTNPGYGLTYRASKLAAAPTPAAPAPAATAPTVVEEPKPAADAAEQAARARAAIGRANPLDLVQTAFGQCTCEGHVVVLLDAVRLEAETARKRIAAAGKPAAPKPAAKPVETPKPAAPAPAETPKPAAQQPKPADAPKADAKPAEQPKPTPPAEKAPRTGEAILASLEAGKESITGLKKPEMSTLAATLGIPAATAANWGALRGAVSAALKARKTSKPAAAPAPVATGKPSEAVQGLIRALREELAGNIDALAALELVAEAAAK